MLVQVDKGDPVNGLTSPSGYGVDRACMPLGRPCGCTVQWVSVEALTSAALTDPSAAPKVGQHQQSEATHQAHDAQKPPTMSVGKSWLFIPKIPEMRVNGKMMAPMTVSVVVTSANRALDWANCKFTWLR